MGAGARNASRVGQAGAPLYDDDGLPHGSVSVSFVAMGAADFLRRELARRQARNARYSLRAFARDLDCDHATLSQWLRGTRPLSNEAEEYVFGRLDLGVDERARARELDDDDLRVFEAVRTQPITTSELAAAAGVAVDRANIALTKLLRLRVVRLDQSRWHILEEVQ
jgi:transcriptional regulator with XRE-family HTH domain